MARKQNRKRKPVGARRHALEGRKILPLAVAATQHSKEQESDDTGLLRQNLRTKLLHDEEKVARAIDFERERQPQGTLKQWVESAIERWERDNR